ncbi:hypothetical protein [Burkholderia multivorans]|uniref:hypothetical protein n=1 Tax=Burkholderia multivorans TaxID=87883 RepID=UPI000CFFD76D|nr:hypothetical protein [Burkholderia multivorans]PRE18147.1 hypothetical protein C6P92_11855 [Burkholderia multivorans]PRG51347.1 hypothetical protein C6T62_00015 [Burkholderia multivorans]
MSDFEQLIAVLREMEEALAADIKESRARTVGLTSTLRSVRNDRETLMELGEQALPIIRDRQRHRIQSRAYQGKAKAVAE